jgi:hypothetical protein
MTGRERLPNRRASYSFAFELGGLHYTCTYSCFGDGRLAEVFLQNHKPSSQSDVNAREAAVAVSLALQYGAPAAVIQAALLRNPDGSASSPVGHAIDRIIKMGTAS